MPTSTGKLQLETETKEGPVKVLMVDASDRGGIALYTDHMVGGLIERGIDVHLCAGGDRSIDSPGLPTAPWGDRAQPQAVLVRYARWAWGVAPRWRAFRRAVSRVQPDVIHLQTIVVRRLDHVLIRWTKPRRAAVVMTVHNALPHDGGEAEARREARRWRAAHVLIVHDDAAKYQVETSTRRPVNVVPVDLIGGPTGLARAQARRDLGLGDGPIVLSLGLVRPYKGYGLLADLWAQVTTASPQATLAIVGAIPEAFDAIERLLLLPSVDARLRWHTDREMNLWAAAADVCLLPYDHGAHSGVLHRAVANGTPVIASSCLRDEVERYHAGLVLPLDARSWSTAVLDVITGSPLPVPMIPSSKSQIDQTLEAYHLALTLSRAQPAMP